MARIEPDAELRNFLRANLTDLNSSGHAGANWIFSGTPRTNVVTKGFFPRVFIKKLPGRGTPIGNKDNTTFNDANLQIDVLTTRANETLTLSYTDQSLGVISNSPRISFADIPTKASSITNIKHNTVAFGTVTQKSTEALFTSPASLAAGTVEWCYSTGTLNFSSADLASYAGQTITSTYSVDMDAEVAAMWIARQVCTKIEQYWRTDSTIGKIIQPVKTLDPVTMPYMQDEGVVMVSCSYNFKRFNIGEAL